MHWLNSGFGRRLTTSFSSEDELNRLGFFLGAGAQTNVDAGPDQVHPADVQTCRHLGHRVATGDTSAQHRPHAQSSGFSSCSIVGTSSLTVGWMCMVRDIAV